MFVDYTNDVGYVGPDDGNLYKVTGVFTGAPTLAGAPFPLQVSLTSNGKILTSPVLDSITQRIFIGTGDGLIKMVRLSASDPCTGAVPAPCVDTTVANLNSTGSHAIIDPPVVESVNGSLFVFLNDNGAQNFALMQADTSLSLASRVIVTAGANTGQPAHAGALDNAYLFVNPPLGSQPSLGQADTNSIGQFDFSFNRIRPFAGGDRPSAYSPYAELLVDEIRIGESYADVTPFIPALQIARNGTNIILTWSGSFNLQASPQPDGSFLTISNATSPYTNAVSATQRFFRLSN